MCICVISVYILYVVKGCPNFMLNLFPPVEMSLLHYKQVRLSREEFMICNISVLFFCFYSRKRAKLEFNKLW